MPFEDAWASSWRAAGDPPHLASPGHGRAWFRTPWPKCAQRDQLNMRLVLAFPVSADLGLIKIDVESAKQL